MKKQEQRQCTRKEIEAFHLERMQKLFPDEICEISRVSWLSQVSVWRVYYYSQRGDWRSHFTALYWMVDPGEHQYLNGLLETELPAGYSSVAEEDVAIRAEQDAVMKKFAASRKPVIEYNSAKGEN